MLRSPAQRGVGKWAMSPRGALLAPFLFAMALGALSTSPAAGTETQFRAAMTKIFLWQYHAFPIFALNPVYPGDVVQLDNEQIVLDHRTCYPNWSHVRYAHIAPYTSGLAASVSIGASIKGDLLAKEIAEIEASGSAKFSQTMKITVNPLSDANAPDIAALSHPATTPDCRLIQQLIGGKFGKYVITYRVLHGVRDYQLTIEEAGSLDAKAKGELLALIMKVFALKEAQVTMSGNTASFEVSELPGEMDLAISPAYYSAEDLNWITEYLWGKRGDDLDVAVDEAIRANDKSAVRAIVIRIRDLFGNQYARAREIWARRFAQGERMTPVNELHDVNFRSVGDFGAAMVLTQGTDERR